MCRQSVVAVFKMLEGEDYQSVLEAFPAVQFAFSYGSGVIQQAGYDYSQENSLKLPMCDFIFAVEDPVEWHKENLEKNPSHYTCFLNPKMLVKFIQGPESSGAALWFNVEAPLYLSNKPPRRMKYGIVRTSKLLEDLLCWDYLYLAGRLHKPVTIFSSSSKSDPEEIHQQILRAIDINRIFALNVALLTLPSQFSERDLYLQIAGLSYRGDPRLLFAENPNKVQNIVLPNLPAFRTIYRPLFSSEASLVSSISVSFLLDEADQAPLPRVSHDHPSDQFTLNNFLSCFPPNFVDQLTSQDASRLYLHYLSAFRAASGNDSNNGSSNILPQRDREKIIDSALRNIIAWPALVQSAKGILTVGTGKGGSYLFAKILKRFSPK